MRRKVKLAWLVGAGSRWRSSRSRRHPPARATTTTYTAPTSTSIPARDLEVDGEIFDIPAGVRNDGTECLEPEPGEAKPKGVHDKISVIRVPLADPAAADDRTPHMARTNWVYTNVREETLPLAGIVTHIIGGRYFDVTACHDINTFFEINRAAGAC